MTETATTTTTETTPAATTTEAAATTTPPAAPTEFVFPDPLPTDEAEFVTDPNPKARQKVNGTLIGLVMEKDRNDNRVFRLAIKPSPGQTAKLVSTGEVGPIDGLIVITTKYLTAAAQESAWAALRIAGLDYTIAAKRSDATSVALVAKLRAAGATQVDIDKNATMLAILQGAWREVGLGSTTFRFDTKVDTYVNPSTGAETKTIKVGWIEAIPAPVALDELESLVASFGAGMVPGTKTAKAPKPGTPAKPGASSAPPSPKDDVAF